MQGPKQTHWPIFLSVAVLVCLVATVFRPILGFEFVDYDTKRQLLDNPRVHGLSCENLKHIATSRCITSYYPVRTLSFALDYQLWGLDPGGFKLTNGLIHLSNVLLVFWLILRLFDHPISTATSPRRYWDLAVATFSAGIFAVHPVVVEPVTWVAGREELLMTLGALGCIHFHLTARRLSEMGGRTARATACFVASAACCAAACLSNAVAAVIPLLIAACDLLTLTGPKLQKTLRGTFSLWMIGIATIVIKRLGADGNLVASQPGTFSFERLNLVLNVYLLNLKTLFLPSKLSVEYPMVKPEGILNEGTILGGLAIVSTCWVLWHSRQRKSLLLGLVWFVLALGPTAQIMSHHIHRADRFLYLPLVGLVVVASTVLRPLVNLFKGRLSVVGAVVAGLLGLVLLDMLSIVQVQTWRNSLSMWENCLIVDPRNALAQGGLADNLAERGQFDEAIQHYDKALEIDPQETETLQNFALLLASCPDTSLRDCPRAIELAIRACQLMDPPDPAALMTLAETYAQAERPEMTATAIEDAIAAAVATGDLTVAEDLRRRLKEYVDNHEKPSSPAAVGVDEHR